MSIHTVANGSIGTLWKISSGLMVSFLSMMGMVFADRLFLSHYSSTALSAATSAGTFFWSISLMWITLASMAEVFVAQYNGSKQYQKLAEPVWQMIFLAGMSLFFFLIVGSFGGRYLLTSGFMNVHEVEYFQWSSYFAPCAIALTALNSFYIGQGKTGIIKWLGLVGNGVNIVLDPLLIFGYKGIVPSMGIRGAVIATGIGIIVQVVILGSMFLSQKNRALFGTGQWRFKLSPFVACIKIGASPAIFAMFELLGWALFYKMMEQISEQHILVASVTQSVLLLFFFFGLGLEKGAAAVAGNLIGGRKLGEVLRVFKSGLYLSLLFGIFISLILGVFPDLFAYLFVQNSTALAESRNPEFVTAVQSAIRGAMITLIFYLTLENIRWLLSGLLTAAGDTLYLLIAGALSIWIFMLLPTYIFVVKPKAPIATAFYIWIFYAALSTLLLFLRFWRGAWKKKQIIALGVKKLDGEGKPSSAPSQYSSGKVGSELTSQLFDDT